MRSCVIQYVLLSGIITTLTIQTVLMVQFVDVFLLGLGICDPPRHEVGKDLCCFLCCGLLMFLGVFLVRLVIANPEWDSGRSDSLTAQFPRSKLCILHFLSLHVVSA